MRVFEDEVYRMCMAAICHGTRWPVVPGPGEAVHFTTNLWRSCVHRNCVSGFDRLFIETA